MNEVAIISAARTPIGNFGGGLKDISAAELGKIAATEAIKRAGLSPDQIDASIFGLARQAGNGPNISRQISYHSQVPVDKVAFTVNKACASGLKSITLGAQSIMLGENNIVLAGGVESMSQVPYLLKQARWGYRLGDGVLIDSNNMDGYYDPLSNMVMGKTVDILAEEYKISREEQDKFAVDSNLKAFNAWENGSFKEEIVPVEIKGRKGKITKVDRDERPRNDSNEEKLNTLSTVFRSKEEGGTITAANSSGITDGGAAVILMRADIAKSEGLEPMAIIKGFASAGVEPARMGLGPVPATKKVMAQTGLELNDFDLIELNEAFAAQVLIVEMELKWDIERRNVHGGAVGLGHPTGCTGARMIVTLLYAMKQRDVELGLATLCISGGLGMSLVLER